MGLSAQAQTADQIETIVTCSPLKRVMDLGIEVKVTQGGIAGLTELVVDRYFLGHTSHSTYYVQELATQNVGSGIVFKGTEASLYTNFTTAPVYDGGHLSHLILTEAGKNPETIDLSCKPNFNN